MQCKIIKVYHCPQKKVVDCDFLSNELENREIGLKENMFQPNRCYQLLQVCSSTEACKERKATGTVRAKMGEDANVRWKEGS